MNNYELHEEKLIPLLARGYNIAVRKDGTVGACGETFCKEECIFFGKCDCTGQAEKWLRQEVSKSFEYRFVVLNHLKEQGYKYIACDPCGLTAHKTTPEFDWSTEWYECRNPDHIRLIREVLDFDMKNHTYKSIDDLLKGEQNEINNTKRI